MYIYVTRSILVLPLNIVYAKRVILSRFIHVKEISEA